MIGTATAAVVAAAVLVLAQGIWADLLATPVSKEEGELEGGETSC